MKKCFKCQIEKEINEFYRHPMMADGRLGKCKECAKNDVTENRIKNIERIRAYDRARGNRHTLADKRRLKKQYVKKYPMAILAHRIVDLAERRGLVKKKPCEVCGNDKSHGHHEDYLRPLDLVWLCALHHRRRHLEIKEKGIDTHASMTTAVV